MLRSADGNWDILRAPNASIGRRGATRPETQQRLKGGHGLPPTVVSKDELVQIDLELRATDTMMRADQPLLEITNRPVGQRYHRLGTLAERVGRRLRPLNMLKAGSRQPGELFQPIGIDGRSRYDMLLDAIKVVALKSGITAIRTRPDSRPRSASPGSPGRTRE